MFWNARKPSPSIYTVRLYETGLQRNLSRHLSILCQTSLPVGGRQFCADAQEITSFRNLVRPATQPRPCPYLVQQ